MGQIENRLQDDFFFDIFKLYINNNINGNGLNTPIKRQRFFKWMKKQSPLLLTTQDSL